ncbi:hypothetical protein BDQ17DRAFT_684423 [Cyathus striatus]|nr:hypothetical protein BDQ17DRAFT_684423 [Cyathus striatus]
MHTRIDKPVHFYCAQLKHLGIRDWKTKDAAKRRLLAAFRNGPNGEMIIPIPSNILELGGRMKEYWSKLNTDEGEDADKELVDEEERENEEECADREELTDENEAARARNFLKLTWINREISIAKARMVDAKAKIDYYNASLEEVDDLGEGMIEHEDVGNSEAEIKTKIRAKLRT